MEALWRCTTSVFLVLALNIRCILSQNVGPNCPLPLPTLQAEPLRDCNPGLRNPQLQMNNMYPPNGLAPGRAVGALECQRSAFQDRICRQCQPNLPANVPIPQTNIGPLNTQILQCSSCTGPPGPLNPGPFLPFNQPFFSQDQCPIGPAIRSCLPQPFNQGLLPGPCQTLTGPPVAPFASSPNGIDNCLGPQAPSLCQQIEPSPLPNGVAFLNNYSSLLPTINPGAPSTDMLPPQGIALPPLLPQGISPMCSPFTPYSQNQGSVDVFPPGATQCPSALNGPSVNSLLPLSNRLPIQGSTLPASQINCLPQGPGCVPQCDVLPDPCVAPVAPPPLQTSFPFSPLNMFRFPRPALFPPISAFQGSFANNNLSPTCDLNLSGPATPNQGSLCDNLMLTPQEPIFFPQVPLGPATFTPNVPGMSNQNVFPLQSSCIPQPAVNSGACSLATDAASIRTLPPTVPPQSCNIPPIAPMNTSPSCFRGSVPLLPTPFNEPYDISGIFPSANAVPIPINLEINVPPPVIPAPEITIINTLPASEAAASGSNFDLPYSMPPLIIEGRRSSSRSWLPLLLVALIGRDGNEYGGGCSCDSGPIPIPYPIPIPTNNPVIMNN